MRVTTHFVRFSVDCVPYTGPSRAHHWNCRDPVLPTVPPKFPEVEQEISGREPGSGQRPPLRGRHPPGGCKCRWRLSAPGRDKRLSQAERKLSRPAPPTPALCAPPGPCCWWGAHARSLSLLPGSEHRRQHEVGSRRPHVPGLPRLLGRGHRTARRGVRVPKEVSRR